MNGFIKSLVLVGAVASLSACAACPVESDYNRTPYGNRTSGEGVAVYDGNCKRSTETMSTRTERVETRREEPASTQVFEQRVRK